MVAGYVVLLAVIALGSAGIVATWAHPPGTAARAELTWQGDGAVTPKLDRAGADLGKIAADVDRLATLARGALAALNAQDQAPFSDALSQGTTVAASIQSASTTLRAALVDLPGDDPASVIEYGADVLARRGAMLDALASTTGLGRSWATLTAGSLLASQLLDLLDRHDPLVADAAAKGRAAAYADALTVLAGAIALLDQATTIRDQLANTSDVSTLDDWIARNRRYDQALVVLYSALRDSGGKVNDAVRAAYAEEGAARADLPPDARGLAVIVGDIGRGGLNQAVIAIEQARGRLSLALEALAPAGSAPNA